ncbi:MAG: translation elongation factor 4 [bacterium]|nr:translation elongation factor 4 [bacterium]
MENIRNFVIIAHIDHGKSTLADRFLELTGTITKDKMRPQFLDMMDLEREKGITIKMQPVRMNYVLNSKSYILNLIDTPGHVDFGYEVSRSLAAVEGAILLVDATQGIQAQTIANLELAKKQNLVIIPAVNKIDSPQARIKETKEELANLLNIPEEEIFEISGKSGLNVEKLIEAVIEKVPSPKIETEKPLRALIFDSKFDPFKGVIAFIRVIAGKILPNDKVYLMQTKSPGDAKELGFFRPNLEPTQELNAGEIGYIATGIKEPEKVTVGDTITSLKFKIQGLELPEALPGYKEPKPMVFASLFPEDQDDFENLKVALSKLKLSDAALIFEPETKELLGRGFRCGFLGTLHAEIISERLKREFGLNLIISAPSVVYRIIDNKDREIFIYSSGEWPEQGRIKESQEPWVRLEIITPPHYLGQVSELLKKSGAKQIETKYFSPEKLFLIWEAPLRVIISGFFDRLKGASQGFASMNYEVLGYRKANLVRLEILIAGKKEEALSRIVPEDLAADEGKKLVEKLKEVMPPQQFVVPLQAAIGGKIIARENVGARRKDVTGYLYGGDYTRKSKLLEKQKKGKKELKEKGQLSVPPKVYMEMLKI